MTTKPKTRKRTQSVLGLTLIDGQLRASHVTRAKGGLEVVKSASAAMTLDLLHPEPELVGREIRNHLDAAGIHERHCVLGIPPRWLMSQHTAVPNLSTEDTASLLQIEAEKGFPVDPVELQIARSFQRATAGSYVTQLAVRQEHVDQLGAVLKAAGLKPVSYSLGLAALPEVNPPAGAGRITVAAEPGGVTMLVSVGGGIAALRTCETSIETEAGVNLVNGASVVRELRITFEQVPAILRSEIKELRLIGDTAIVRSLAETLAEWARANGLALSRGDLPEKDLGSAIAEKLAANWVSGGGVELEFLPPRPGRWALLMARYNSKRLATAGFGVAALALITACAFVWLEYKRWSLRSEWNAMQAQVTGLDAVQARIREYRPWYDMSFRGLSVLKRITECFPENGTVTARTYEMRGKTLVTISGTARDNASLLRVQDQLRLLKEVQGLKIEQIRGTTPLQFTMTFRWNDLAGT